MFGGFVFGYLATTILMHPIKVAFWLVRSFILLSGLGLLLNGIAYVSLNPGGPNIGWAMSSNVIGLIVLAVWWVLRYKVRPLMR